MLSSKLFAVTGLPADFHLCKLLPNHSQAPFPPAPILGAEQRGDAADGGGVDGDRQALLTQLGFNAEAEEFVVFHVLSCPILSCPALPCPNRHLARFGCDRIEHKFGS
jgi:hypothetical protein